MSASISSALFPFMASAAARLTATVDLPAPPLPEVTTSASPMAFPSYSASEFSFAMTVDSFSSRLSKYASETVQAALAVWEPA